MGTCPRTFYEMSVICSMDILELPWNFRHFTQISYGPTLCVLNLNTTLLPLLLSPPLPHDCTPSNIFSRVLV